MFIGRTQLCLTDLFCVISQKFTPQQLMKYNTVVSQIAKGVCLEQLHGFIKTIFGTRVLIIVSQKEAAPYIDILSYLQWRTVQEMTHFGCNANNFYGIS